MKALTTGQFTTLANPLRTRGAFTLAQSPLRATSPKFTPSKDPAGFTPATQSEFAKAA